MAKQFKVEVKVIDYQQHRNLKTHHLEVYYKHAGCSKAASATERLLLVWFTMLAITSTTDYKQAKTSTISLIHAPLNNPCQTFRQSRWFNKKSMCICNLVQVVGDPNKRILDGSKHKRFTSQPQHNNRFITIIANERLFVCLSTANFVFPERITVV